MQNQWYKAEETVGFYGKDYFFIFRNGGAVTVHRILLF